MNISDFAGKKVHIIGIGGSSMVSMRNSPAHLMKLRMRYAELSSRRIWSLLSDAET